VHDKLIVKLGVHDLSKTVVGCPSISIIAISSCWLLIATASIITIIDHHLLILLLLRLLRLLDLLLRLLSLLASGL